MSHEFTPAQLEECRLKLKLVIDTLGTFANDLDEHRTNVHISKVVGGAAATVGTAIAVVGAVGSFFTMGLAAPLIGVGAVVGGLGGGTIAGSSIVGTIIKKSKLEDAEKMWTDLMKDPVLHQFLRRQDDLDGEVRGIAEGVTRGLKFGVQMGGLAVKSAARVLTVAGVALELVFLPFSLYDLIHSSIELHNKTKSPAGEKLRELAKLLKKVHHEITKELRRPLLTASTTTESSKPVEPAHSRGKPPIMHTLPKTKDMVWETILQLESIADDLDEHNYNVNVSKAVGGALGVIGWGLIVAGIVAAFFARSLAILLVPVGIAVSLAGGKTVVDHSVIQADTQAVKQGAAQEAYHRLLKDPELHKHLRRDGGKGEGEGRDDVTEAQSLLPSGSRRPATEAAFGWPLTRYVVRALPPLSLYDLIHSSTQAYTRSSCPVGNQVRDLAKALQMLYDDL